MTMDGASRSIVICGAGKIGCGHLAPLFEEAGWDVLLAARNPTTVERIHAAGRYTVRLTDGEPQAVEADAVLMGTDAFTEAVAGADLVATAVGARNVTGLAEPLARALVTRPADRPLDVWCVENGDAAPAWRRRSGRWRTPRG